MLCMLAEHETNDTIHSSMELQYINTEKTNSSSHRLQTFASAKLNNSYHSIGCLRAKGR